MAKQRKQANRVNPNGTEDFRHPEVTRKNNPPAGLAPTYEVREQRTQHYAYNPHEDPQLVWAGKAEHTSFEVDVVSLHIHEYVSTKAILSAVRRPEPVQLSFFGETPLPADQQLAFYQHDVDWTNRLILGDSLLVMNSLLVKEGVAGKVQMIYMDPPYGIKYASNFQPRIDRRDVKDQDADLTHEPEQIKAYRDTWKLGIHSYLTYLRDRLLLCRELLHESGSIFVQINDENLHLVRCLLDEVFGRENFILQIVFLKTSGKRGKFLEAIYDYLLWYAKDKESLKYHQLYLPKSSKTLFERYTHLETPDGEILRLTEEQLAGKQPIPEGRRFTDQGLLASGTSSDKHDDQSVLWQGKRFTPPPGRKWKSPVENVRRLALAERLIETSGFVRYKLYFDDFPVAELHGLWDDTGYGALIGEKLYAVQTTTKVIERCILMTTDPGDLVFDPTCGSGTTAYCAEKWGRRWITCDTSRVAVAIARQRLMTARFDYYELKDPARGPAGGFEYERVPHITLESIAKNTEIDAIAERYKSDIETALALLNEALGQNWQEWEVPREEAEDWPEEATEAHCLFWELKRKKRQEIDESIRRNAPSEDLRDRPRIRRGVVRVSGPFTVEAIPAPAIEDPMQAPVPQFEEEEARARVSDPGGDYLGRLVNLLKAQGGVLFKGGKKLELQNLRRLGLGMLHAEAEAVQNGRTIRVAVSFGPQYGPVTAFQVQEAVPTAKMNGYDLLILAGFSFDPEAQALLQRTPVAGIKVEFVNISPDVLVEDLLKANRASQIFTAFGQPDVKLEKNRDGTWTVELEGVDIYDPLTGEVYSTSGNDVAAWFLDTDYDGATFHICQAFFPGDADAWEKLQRALKAQIAPEAFERMRGTCSFPFKPGDHKRVAVKVIDFRGNEVMAVRSLGEEAYGR